MRSKLLSSFIAYIFATTIHAQANLFFEPFVGKAYVIPSKELEKGHGPHVYDNEVIGDITLEALDISKSDDNDRLFPGIKHQAKFGLVLYSKVIATETGCYAIELESDDGSKLWIDKQLIINNDRPHKMKCVVDTSYLQKGEHEVKLWYYNAYPTQYGLLMKHKFIAPDGCDVKTQLPAKPNLQTITLQSQFLFDFDEFELKSTAKQELDKLCDVLNNKAISQLTIIGFTDSSGKSDYNLVLSANRAHAVRSYIATRLNLNAVEVKTIGAGESNPVSSNKTERGRKENRRVEITFQ